MRRLLPLLAALLAAALSMRGLAWWHARAGEALFDGNVETQLTMSRGADRWVEAPLDRGDFPTGSARFDGEWLFATRMMAALGYAQIAIEHPEQRAAMRPRIARCLDALADPRARAFDAEAWAHDPLEDLGTDRAHVAYLGYLSLAIALAEEVDPETPHRELGDRIAAHLMRLYERSETGLLETYPGEIYPVDNASFAGALGLRARRGEPGREALARLVASLERHRDPQSGLLVQSIDPQGGRAIDLPRGSGSALAAYFVSFASADLSRSLHGSVRRSLVRSTLGFGTTREYLPGQGGLGDVDSGPVLFGQGVSATGFTLASARANGDRGSFVRAYATASLVGGRVDARGTHYAMGGPIGDALLFALTTAQPAERWR